jgi:hypothetical protein
MFLSNWQLLAASISLHQQRHISQFLTNGEIDNYLHPNNNDTEAIDGIGHSFKRE